MGRVMRSKYVCMGALGYWLGLREGSERWYDSGDEERLRVK